MKFLEPLAQSDFIREIMLKLQKLHLPLRYFLQFALPETYMKNFQNK